MHFGRNDKVFGRAIKAAVGLGLAVFILTASFVSVCPSLHSRIHHHSEQGGHYCLVCAFINTLTNVAAEVISATVILLAVFAETPLNQTVPILPFLSSQFRGRAPPA